MRTKGLILLTLILSIFFSCQKEGKKGSEGSIKTFSISDFKSSDTLQLKFVDSLDVNLCNDMKFNDSLLYFVDPYAKYQLIITDTTGKIVRRTIRKGQGPGEMTYLFYINFVTDSLLYAYDGYALRYFLIFRKSDIIKKSNPKPIKSLTLGQGYSSIKCMIDDSKFISVNSRTKDKFYIQDTSFRILRKIGQFNFKNINENNIYYINTAYNNKIAVSPDKRKFAAFYTHLDLIEIYDTTGSLIFRAKGPDNIELYNFNPSKITRSKAYATTEKKSKWAYKSVKTYKNYIFALYNGNFDDDKAYFKNQKLLVFDWNGNLIKYFYLTEPIVDFAIDAQNNVLYAFNGLNTSLYKAKFNLD